MVNTPSLIFSGYLPPLLPCSLAPFLPSSVLLTILRVLSYDDNLEPTNTSPLLCAPQIQSRDSNIEAIRDDGAFNGVDFFLLEPDEGELHEAVQ